MKRTSAIIFGALVGILLAIVNEFLVVASNEPSPQTKDTIVSVLITESVLLVVLVALLYRTRKSRYRWALVPAGGILCLAFIWALFTETSALPLVPWKSEFVKCRGNCATPLSP